MLKQDWGEAQISGVLHNVNVSADGFDNETICGPDFASACNGRETKVGWGVDAGVKVNLPSFGDGDDMILTGAFTQNAAWYSGLADGMWGENGQVNGNGQPMYLADAFFNPVTNAWAKPMAWSVSTLIEHHFTPQFYIDLEGSIGGINWNNQGGCSGISVFAGLCPLSSIGGPLSPHDRRRRPQLEPRDEPQLRSRADVSGGEPEHGRMGPSARSTTSANQTRFSSRAPGKETATAWPAACASPATSDRFRSVAEVRLG